MSTLRPEAAHRGHHTQEGWRGMWVSLALVWGGREDQLCQQRGRGSPRLCGGGQVKCRWWWFVALLINKGTPLGGGHAPGWRACPWVEGAPLGEGRAPGWRVRPWVKGTWWFFFSFFLRVLQLGFDDKTPLALIQRETLACLIMICSL